MTLRRAIEQMRVAQQGWWGQLGGQTAKWCEHADFWPIRWVLAHDSPSKLGPGHDLDQIRIGSPASGL